MATRDYALDELVVGAPQRTCGEGTNSGALYIYQPSDDPADYACAAVLCNPSERADEFFGTAFAVSDFDGDGTNEIAVGAPGAAGTGGVYVYEYSPTTGTGQHDCQDPLWTLHAWSPRPSVFPTAGSTGDRFGEVLAAGLLSESSLEAGVAASSLAVGAPGTNGGEGAVVVLHPSLIGTLVSPLDVPETLTRAEHAPSPSGSTWEFGAALVAADLDGIGPLVELAIGAPAAEVAGAVAAGEVCRTSYGLLSRVACFSSEAVPGHLRDPGERFGAALAVGHFDGVELERQEVDLAVGAPGWNGAGGTESGAVIVFFGDTRSLRVASPGNFATRVLEGFSPQPAAHFGQSIALASTQPLQNLVDETVLEDLVVGAPDYANVGRLGGAFGGATVTAAQPSSGESLNGEYLQFGPDGGEMRIWLHDDPLRAPESKVQMFTDGSVDQSAEAILFFLVNRQCGTANEGPLMKCEDPFDYDEDGDLGLAVAEGDNYGTEECWMALSPAELEFLRGDHPDVPGMDDGMGMAECPMSATDPKATACLDVVVGQQPTGSGEGEDVAFPTIIDPNSVPGFCAPPMGTGEGPCSSWHLYFNKLSPTEVEFAGHSKSGVPLAWGDLCLSTATVFERVHDFSSCE